jgi:hypothetical protein
MARATLLTNEKTLEFLGSIQPLFDSGLGKKNWNEAIALADRLGTDDSKIELFLDSLLRTGHRRIVKSAQEGRGAETLTELANLALAAAHLQRRLDRHANKKLVALAAAGLAL